MWATSLATSNKPSTASDLRVRPATRADRPRLAEIFLIARRHTFTWLPPERFRLRDLDRETEGETLLLAELDGCIAGFVAVWEPDAFLHHLYVDPEMHRRGVGRALIEAAGRLCGRPLELKCQTNNRSAMAFYKSLGFTLGESGVSDIGPWMRHRGPAEE